MTNDERLRARLAPFLERGLVRAVPTRGQLMQGSIEMAPYVLSPDVTSESSYRPHIWAHPIVRQLSLVQHIGLDHFNVGSGLSVSLDSVCKHLILTWHAGMPTYDLQIVQTHPRGLDRLRSEFEGVLEPTTPQTRALRRLTERLFPDPGAYFHRFLSSGGWIERAARFDYPKASKEAANMPEEFYSLVGFVDHCAKLPMSWREVGAPRVPAHLLRLVSRRFRTTPSQT